jgi:hypothetical protein
MNNTKIIPPTYRVPLLTNYQLPPPSPPVTLYPGQALELELKLCVGERDAALIPTLPLTPPIIPRKQAPTVITACLPASLSMHRRHITSSITAAAQLPVPTFHLPITAVTTLYVYVTPNDLSIYHPPLSPWPSSIQRLPNPPNPPPFLLLPSFIPSLIFSLPSFLPFRMSFLPYFLTPFLISFLPDFLPSFLPFFLPSFLPFFLPSLFPSFLPSCLDLPNDDRLSERREGESGER